MSYITLHTLDRALRLTLTVAGRDELAARIENGDSIEDDVVLYDLLEDHLSNGWERLNPEEIGALTSAPILTDDCHRDQDGVLTTVGTVYWYEPYQVLSPVAELMAHGYVDFRRAG